MERHIIEKQLKDKTGYWQARIMAEINYLEQYILANPECGFDKLLEDAVALLNEAVRSDGAVTQKTAAVIEEKLSAASKAVKETTVNCIGHAHIDMNWMWRYDETVSITISTVRTMLDLMKEYPNFTFAQSQASVYRIIDEYAPDMIEEIKTRIKENRWEVTASTWVETDKNMPNGESLTRHLIYSRQYLKKLLDLSDEDFYLDFEPDTFGHNINVPEILTRGGVKYYYHCRGHEGQSIYRWRSPSKSEITVYCEPMWYISSVDYDSFAYVPLFCADNSVNQVLYVYGVGDHGGGVTRRDIDRLIDMMSWPCMPTIRFGKYLDFFKYLDTLELPVVDTELNAVFSGCYTTQTRIKRANRAAEATLDEAESFNALSDLLGGYRYDAGRYSEDWKRILFNHFHDILPGSGTTDTREFALGEFQKAMADAGSRKSFAVRSIASMIDTTSLLKEPDKYPDSVSEGAGGGYGVENFNYVSASHNRGINRLYTIFNPSQYENSSLCEIAVFDWQGDMELIGFFDENGSPVEYQLLDKKPQKYWIHSYFRVLVNVTVPAYGYRTVRLSQINKAIPAKRFANPRVYKVPECVLENDFLRAEFDLNDSSLVSLIDKTSGKELIKNSGGFRYIEEASKSMSAWVIDRYMLDEAVCKNIKFMRRTSGELRNSLEFNVRIKSSVLNFTVFLDKNSRALTYDVKCNWREVGTRETGVPQLGYRIPLSSHCDSYRYDVPFGIIDRAPRKDDSPALSYIYAGGVMLCTDSKYGFRGTDDSLYVDLIRSAYDPDSTPEVYDHSFKIFVGIPESDRAADLGRLSRTLCHTMSAVDNASHPGKLAPCGSFLNVSDGAVISSVKLAEDGSGDVIIRGWNTTGAPLSVKFTSAFTPKSACLTDIHEVRIFDIDINDGVSFTADAFSSFTVRMAR